jgi:hydrogenase maturation factor
MFNTVQGDIYGEFAKTGIEVPATAFDFAAFVDASAALNLENIENVTVFAFVCPKDKAKIRKALKDDLQYVEAYARQGYIGTVAGINLYDKADATEGEIIVATRDAVTIFNKKGVEIEQERDANTRVNSAYSRKYYVVALTDESKAVKIKLTA